MPPLWWLSFDGWWASLIAWQYPVFGKSQILYIVRFSAKWDRNLYKILSEFPDVYTWESPYSPSKPERSIFQTFWKIHCCPDFLFLELETSNFGYLLIFWFPLTVESFSKIIQHGYLTFYEGPPFEFLVDYKIKRHPRGKKKNIQGGPL